MNHTNQIETIENNNSVNCDDLSILDERLARDILARASDKWSLWVLYVLHIGGKMRFSRVLERVEGISQKMLTKTLRQLERDGFISRTMFMEVPPRVEYELTALGYALQAKLLPLWEWIMLTLPDFKAARALFDQAKAKQ